MEDGFTPPHYPVLRFLTRHGVRLAVGLGVLLSVVGAVLALSGAGWIWLPVGVVVGLLSAVLLASYVEVLRIISDTLIPR